MKEETENAVAELISRMVDGLDKTVEFGSEHLPILVQQYLMFELIQAVIFAVLGTVVAVGLSVFILRKLKDKPENKESQDTLMWRYSSYGGDLRMTDTSFPVLLFGSLAIFLSAGTAITQGLLAAKILIAPYVYILEYARSFM